MGLMGAEMGKGDEVVERLRFVGYVSD